MVGEGEVGWEHYRKRVATHVERPHKRQAMAGQGLGGSDELSCDSMEVLGLGLGQGQPERSRRELQYMSCVTSILKAFRVQLAAFVSSPVKYPKCTHQRSPRQPVERKGQDGTGRHIASNTTPTNRNK